MTHADLRGISDGMKTAAGLWLMPITLSTDRRMADGIKTGSAVALTAGEVLAIMKVGEKYEEAGSSRSVAVVEALKREIRWPGRGR
jgi:ATP sulfurylase